MTGDLVFELSDKTGDPRTPEEMVSLRDAVSDAVRDHGYKWRTMGTRPQMRQLYAGEQTRLDTEDTCQMLAEWRAARDAKENEQCAL